MTMKSVENYPQFYARLWGALYLLVIVLGGFAEGFVTDKLIVAGNVAASAQNILACGIWVWLQICSSWFWQFRNCGLSICFSAESTNR